MSGSEQLKQALLKKQTGNPPPIKPKGSIPDPIQYIKSGTHMAPDGKPYTITYDKEQNV